MNPELIALVLTALAAVVIVLTRVRMARGGEEHAAGRIDLPRGLVNVHTVCGTLALILWVYFLLANPSNWFGFVGLLLWWITAVAGLLILARWMPAHGRHASGPAADSWGEGPGLSVLAHVGLVVGCVIWTTLFALGKL